MMDDGCWMMDKKYWVCEYWVVGREHGTSLIFLGVFGLRCDDRRTDQW